MLLSNYKFIKHREDYYKINVMTWDRHTNTVVFKTKNEKQDHYKYYID